MTYKVLSTTNYPLTKGSHYYYSYDDCSKRSVFLRHLNKKKRQPHSTVLFTKFEDIPNSGHSLNVVLRGLPLSNFELSLVSGTTDWCFSLVLITFFPLLGIFISFFIFPTSNCLASPRVFWQAWKPVPPLVLVKCSS